MTEAISSRTLNFSQTHPFRIVMPLPTALPCACQTALKQVKEILALRVDWRKEVDKLFVELESVEGMEE